MQSHKYNASFFTSLSKIFFFLLISFFFALGVRFLVHTFIVFPLTIFNQDLSPQLKQGDRVTVWRIFNAKKKLHRDGIVYLKLANHYPVLRRIVALPNERVVVKQGRVYINDAILELPSQIQAGQLYSFEKNKFEKIEADSTKRFFTKEYILGNDEYFLLADDRKTSIDSRLTGPVKKSKIEGVVISK